MKVSDKRRLVILHTELAATKQALALSMIERTNIRKAYDEVNERSKLIADDLTRRLQNAEASNQNLSQAQAKLTKLAGELALEKDKLADALAKSVGLLHQMAAVNQHLLDRVSGKKDTLIA